MLVRRTGRPGPCFMSNPVYQASDATWPWTSVLGIRLTQPQITYDLHQLPRPQLPPLRDSILASLSALSGPSAPTGSRAVIVQLNLALSDLALQMHEWTDVVGGMVDKYGQDPGTVLLLLGFLKCLVEESGNPRLPISVRDGAV